MGCDIHTRAIDEKGNTLSGRWPEGSPFNWRDYGMFAFLAGVRNYSGVIPIAEPRGLPADIHDADDDDDGWLGDHSFSWLTIAELNAFDYDAIMEDRRVTREIRPNMRDGGCTADPGGGQTMTWREFLGDYFFADLAELNRIGANRIVFGFDS